MIRKLRLLWDVCCFNTLRLNFKYLPFRQAVRLPIWVSRRARIRKAGGKVSINCPISTGMIRIGLDAVGIFDNKRSRSIWQVSGDVVFNGRCFIGHGSKLSVQMGGVMIFGRNFGCTAESSFVVSRRITIGDDCLFSWNVLMMDTDFHPIYDREQNILNPPKPIVIGDKVWIGCRTLVTKGVSIADGTVVAAGSIVSRNIVEPNCVVGKNPMQVLRRDVTWQK